jgi:hypothetical protein
MTRRAHRERLPHVTLGIEFPLLPHVPHGQVQVRPSALAAAPADAAPTDAAHVSAARGDDPQLDAFAGAVRRHVRWLATL